MPLQTSPKCMKKVKISKRSPSGSARSASCGPRIQCRPAHVCVLRLSLVFVSIHNQPSLSHQHTHIHTHTPFWLRRDGPGKAAGYVLRNAPLRPALGIRVSFRVPERNKPTILGSAEQLAVQDIALEAPAPRPHAVPQHDCTGRRRRHDVAQHRRLCPRPVALQGLQACPPPPDQQVVQGASGKEHTVPKVTVFTAQKNKKKTETSIKHALALRAGPGGEGSGCMNT